MKAESLGRAHVQTGGALLRPCCNIVEMMAKVFRFRLIFTSSIIWLTSVLFVANPLNLSNCGYWNGEVLRFGNKGIKRCGSASQRSIRKRLRRVQHSRALPWPGIVLARLGFSPAWVITVVMRLGGIVWLGLWSRNRVSHCVAAAAVLLPASYCFLMLFCATRSWVAGPEATPYDSAARERLGI